MVLLWRGLQRVVRIHTLRMPPFTCVQTLQD